MGVGAWRGTYLPHGWVASPKASSFIERSVRDLANQGFNHQIHNLGRLDATGQVPEADFAGLETWIAGSRATDPSQRILLWVSGHEGAHVNKRELHPRIASHLASLGERFQIDGLWLDLEPFTGENSNLVDLLGRVRRALPTLGLVVNAPGAARWCESFTREVAAPVDAISPMFYDSTLKSPDAYTEQVRTLMEGYLAGCGDSAVVIPSVPAYARNSWHDPAIENIATAMAGVSAATDEGSSVAVYWWHQFDATARRLWQQVRQ